MTKTVVAKRTLHTPGPKFKPMKIDPVTGGHLDAGNYDVKEIAPGKTVDLEDDEADKLVDAGFAEWPDDDKSKVVAPGPNPTQANPPVPPKK